MKRYQLFFTFLISGTLQIPQYLEGQQIFRSLPNRAVGNRHRFLNFANQLENVLGLTQPHLRASTPAHCQDLNQPEHFTESHPFPDYLFFAYLGDDLICFAIFEGLLRIFDGDKFEEITRLLSDVMLNPEFDISTIPSCWRTMPSTLEEAKNHAICMKRLYLPCNVKRPSCVLYCCQEPSWDKFNEALDLAKKGAECTSWEVSKCVTIDVNHVSSETIPDKIFFAKTDIEDFLICGRFLEKGGTFELQIFDGSKIDKFRALLADSHLDSLHEFWSTAQDNLPYYKERAIPLKDL